MSRGRAAGRGDALDRVAAGMYAWIVTVALPSASAATPVLVRVFALLGAVALCAGALLSAIAPLSARLSGVWMFIASCVLVWTLNPAAISAARLDPVQGALGSMGWGLFVLSWAGERRASSRSAANTALSGVGAPPGPRAGALFGAFGAAVAAFPMLVAWWVPGVERALFAHGAALAIAIALVGAATQFLVRDSGASPAGRSEPTSERVGSAFSMLLALSLLLLAGAAYRLLR